MSWTTTKILNVLDRECAAFTFPMLDNGYFHLAAARLSLFRSETDWAVVFELFGFSPGSGMPETYIETFASKLRNRGKASDYPSPEAFAAYLASNPYNEFHAIRPIDEGSWQNEEDWEVVDPNGELRLRGRQILIPSSEECERQGVCWADDRPVNELCRYLAAVYRNDVLCTAEERRVNVPPEMEEILVLDEWHHPDVVEEELPSQVESFQQLADVLVTGDVTRYSPSQPPNTHWKHWPDGGML